MVRSLLFFFFPYKVYTAHQTNPEPQSELYFDAKSSRTRIWCPGANVYAYRVLRRAVYLQWGNERAVTSPLWMRCNTAELLEGFSGGDGTFSMYSIFPSAGHRAGDGQDMISWSVNMINWDLLENFWNMIEAAELLFLLYFNNQQWEESWTHETWNGGLDFWWKSVKLQKRIHWSQT